MFGFINTFRSGITVYLPCAVDLIFNPHSVVSWQFFVVKVIYWEFATLNPTSKKDAGRMPLFPMVTDMQNPPSHRCSFAVLNKPCHWFSGAMVPIVDDDGSSPV